MKKNSPVIVTVNGWSGSGKTTFCENLIRHLTQRGFRVAAAKNSHQELQTDKPGSDSHRFSEAGAGSVCLNAMNSMTVFYSSTITEAGMLSGLFPDADIIIAEGFKTGADFRIEVAGTAESIEGMKNPPENSDLILYADEKLAKKLRENLDSGLAGGKTCIIMHRNKVSEAADIICSLA